MPAFLLETRNYIIESLNINPTTREIKTEMATEFDQYGNEIIDAEIISETDDAVEELPPLWNEVGHHLKTRFNKPIPLSMIDPCLEAIEKANNGEWDSMITLPDGNLYKGEPQASVRTMVDSHALQQWIKNQELITISDNEGNIVWQGYGKKITLAEGVAREEGQDEQ
jgi:hypothetical protein